MSIHTQARHWHITCGWTIVESSTLSVPASHQRGVVDKQPRSRIRSFISTTTTRSSASGFQTPPQNLQVIPRIGIFVLSQKVSHPISSLLPITRRCRCCCCCCCCCCCWSLYGFVIKRHPETTPRHRHVTSKYTLRAREVAVIKFQIPMRPQRNRRRRCSKQAKMALEFTAPFHSPNSIPFDLIWVSIASHNKQSRLRHWPMSQTLKPSILPISNPATTPNNPT